MATEVCKGQQADMDFEQAKDVTETEYVEMIRRKTAVLLATALKFGARLGGAPAEEQDILYKYAIEVGIGFQMMDDYLDTYGDESFGKRIGGDILEDKKTWLYIKAFELASPGEKAVMRNWHGHTDSETKKIDAIRSVYTHLGVDKLILEEIEHRFNSADQYIDQLASSNADFIALKGYVGALSRRNT